MLVLTRKINESVQIGEDINVTVLRIRGGRVSLGIQAPTNVEVMRKELLFWDDDRISNEAAAKEAVLA